MPLILLVSFFSGTAALIHQSLWLRFFRLALGSTALSSSLALGAFMGGLGLGSWLTFRLRAGRPARVYRFVEWAIAASALASLLFLGRLAGSPPEQRWAAILLCAFAVLPVAALSGMAIPLLCEWLRRNRGGAEKHFAALYGVNALGGAAGLLAAAYLLVPVWGIWGAQFFACMLNLMAGALALRLRDAAALSPGSGELSAGVSAGILSAAFLSGCGFFVAETAWIRSLALVIGPTSYAFALMGAAVLLGLTLGSAGLAWGRFRFPPWVAFAATALFVPVSYACLGWLPEIFSWGIGKVIPSFAAYQAWALLLCLAVLLPAAVSQGIAFPMLFQSRGAGSKEAGQLYAYNSAGAALGAFLGGMELVPALGLRGTFLCAAFIFMLCAIFLVQMNRARRGLTIGAAAILVFFAWKLPDPWNPLVTSSGPYLNAFRNFGERKGGQSLADFYRERGDQILFDADGAETRVTVRSILGTLILSNNGKPEGGEGGDLSTQKLVAHLSLAAHGQARRAAVIGWGSGSTVGSASLHPLSEIHCLEIEPRVFEAAHFFGPLHFGVDKDPRLRLRFEDARRDLSSLNILYDVIISEPPNPWISGVASLFTFEFYSLVKRRLEPSGVFGQWMPFSDMDLEGLKTELRTFCAVFPFAQAWVMGDLRQKGRISGDLLLLGGSHSLPPARQSARALFENAGLINDLGLVGLNRAVDLTALFLADKSMLVAFAGQGLLNSDWNPSLEFSSPRFRFRMPPEQALSNRQILDALDQNAPPPEIPENEFLSLAEAWEQLGRFAGAARMLGRIPAAHKSASAQLLRARLAFQKGELAIAQESVEACLKLDSSMRAAWQYKALLHFRLKEDALALETFEAALKRWPRDPAWLMGKAMSLARLGKREAALMDLAQVLKYQPEHKGALSLKGSLESGGDFPDIQ